MSLDSLPDEVLVKILYKPFVNDDPITTSVEAHDIYEAYLCTDLADQLIRQGKCCW